MLEISVHRIKVVVIGSSTVRRLQWAEATVVEVILLPTADAAVELSSIDAVVGFEKRLLDPSDHSFSNIYFLHTGQRILASIVGNVSVLSANGTDLSIHVDCNGMIGGPAQRAIGVATTTRPLTAQAVNSSGRSHSRSRLPSAF